MIWGSIILFYAAWYVAAMLAMVCHSGGGGGYGRGGGTSPMNIHEVAGGPPRVGEVMGLLGWASTEDRGGKTSKHCTARVSLPSQYTSRASQFWALLPWERV